MSHEGRSFETSSQEESESFEKALESLPDDNEASIERSEEDDWNEQYGGQIQAFREIEPNYLRTKDAHEAAVKKLALAKKEGDSESIQAAQEQVKKAYYENAAFAQDYEELEAFNFISQEDGEPESEFGLRRLIQDQKIEWSNLKKEKLADQSRAGELQPRIVKLKYDFTQNLLKLNKEKAARLKDEKERADFEVGK